MRRSRVIISNVTQDLVTAEYEMCGGNFPEGSELDQEGLRIGKKVALEYISHGKSGLAVVHIVYMIQETGVKRKR